MTPTRRALTLTSLLATTILSFTHTALADPSPDVLATSLSVITQPNGEWRISVDITGGAPATIYYYFCVSDTAVTGAFSNCDVNYHRLTNGNADDWTDTGSTRTIHFYPYHGTLADPNERRSANHDYYVAIAQVVTGSDIGNWAQLGSYNFSALETASPVNVTEYEDHVMLDWDARGWNTSAPHATPSYVIYADPGTSGDASTYRAQITSSTNHYYYNSTLPTSGNPYRFTVFTQGDDNHANGGSTSVTAEMVPPPLPEDAPANLTLRAAGGTTYEAGWLTWDDGGAHALWPGETYSIVSCDADDTNCHVDSTSTMHNATITNSGTEQHVYVTRTNATGDGPASNIVDIPTPMPHITTVNASLLNATATLLPNGTLSLHLPDPTLDWDAVNWWGYQTGLWRSPPDDAESLASDDPADWSGSDITSMLHPGAPGDPTQDVLLDDVVPGHTYYFRVIQYALPYDFDVAPMFNVTIPPNATLNGPTNVTIIASNDYDNETILRWNGPDLVNESSISNYFAIWCTGPGLLVEDPHLVQDAIANNTGEYPDCNQHEAASRGVAIAYEGDQATDANGTQLGEHTQRVFLGLEHNDGTNTLTTWTTQLNITGPLSYEGIVPSTPGVTITRNGPGSINLHVNVTLGANETWDTFRACFSDAPYDGHYTEASNATMMSCNTFGEETDDFGTPLGVAELNQSGLQDGATYWYYVTRTREADAQDGHSWQDVRTISQGAYTLPTVTPLDAPTLAGVAHANRANLTWNTIPGASAYTIHACTCSDPAGDEQTWTVTGTSTVAPLASVATWSLSITATSADYTLHDDSPPSTTITLTISDNAPLATPTIHATSGDGVITVTWTNAPTNTTHWDLSYTRDANADPSANATPIPSVTQLVHNVTNYETWNYQIRACPANDDPDWACSAWSTRATATAAPPPPPPPGRYEHLGSDPTRTGDIISGDVAGHLAWGLPVIFTVLLVGMIVMALRGGH